MSDAALKLKNAPIVEAVLDIECDFAPGWSFLDVEAAATERFRDSYPKMRKQFLQQLWLEIKDDKSVNNNVPPPGVQAFQFLHDDEKQLVQVRDKGYSFNRLAPYGSLDDYLPEIRRTWDIYRDLASPILIRLIRLRYINRLNLPLTEGQLNLDEFFKVGPRMPDEDHLTFVGFLNQHQLIERDTGHQVTTVLAAGQTEGDKLPVIFDNAVVANVAADPSDWPLLEATIQSLRGLKNRVFGDTLTDKCLSLFQ